MTWRAGPVAVGIATALSLLALALPGRAGAEAVEAGSTKVEFNRGLFRTLTAAGVEVSKFDRATMRGRVLTLPVSGGEIELATAIGSVEHLGGFKFRSGKRVARLDQIVLDTSKRELYARLDGKRMRIASLPSFAFARAGFGDRIDVQRLRLTGATTTALNRELDLNRVFRPDRAFAAVASSFDPAADRLRSGSMQFSLDPGFVAKLKSLEVQSAPFETAVLGMDPPSFGAALISGEIHPRTGQGWGFVEGGIRIAKLGTPEPESPVPALTLPTLTWINLGLSLESQKLTGFIHAHDKSGQLVAGVSNPIGALDLSGATVLVDPQTRTLSILNARAVLEASTADLINRTFATPKGKAPVLAAGDPLGTFSLTMQAG